MHNCTYHPWTSHSIPIQSSWFDSHEGYRVLRVLKTSDRTRGDWRVISLPRSDGQPWQPGRAMEPPPLCTLISGKYSPWTRLGLKENILQDTGHSHSLPIIVSPFFVGVPIPWELAQSSCHCCFLTLQFLNNNECQFVFTACMYIQHTLLKLKYLSHHIWFN